MAKYEVTETSYINGALRYSGDVVDYDGEPAGNLRPLDKPAEKAAKAALPKPVAALVTAARQQAAMRGAGPDAADASDLAKAVEALGTKPSDDVVTAAVAALTATAESAASLG